MVSVSTPRIQDRTVLKWFCQREIFAHYVNSESYRFRGQRFDPARHLKLLKISLLLNAGRVHIPYAQMQELYVRSKEIQECISIFYDAGLVKFLSPYEDAASFLTSREKLYAGVENKYPVYFGRKIKLIGRPNQVIIGDTTEYIRERFSNAIHDSELKTNMIDIEDVIRLRKNKEFILGATSGEKFGMTYSVFEGKEILPKPAESIFFGDVSWRLFCEKYGQLEQVFPTGYIFDEKIENYAIFPLFDIHVNDAVLKKIRIDHCYDGRLSSDDLVALRFDPHFEDFVYGKMSFILALMMALMESQDKREIPYDRAVALLSAAIGKIPVSTIPLGGAVSGLDAYARILELTSSAKKMIPHFQDSFSKVEVMTPKPLKIVVFTATDKESETFAAIALASGFKPLGTVHIGDQIFGNNYRRGLDVEIIHIQTGMGSAGLHGSQRIAEKALIFSEPHYAVSLGICFCINEKKQSLGDVIFADRISCYEPAGVRNDFIEQRGPKVPVADNIITLAHAMKLTRKGYKLITGHVLSGEKLVDNRVFRDSLLKFESKAVGGEMEGAGIVTACQAAAAKMILIKGICDFAANKTDAAHELAAENAISFFFEFLSDLVKSY
ncbi:hypothetical protein [Phreatobacter sp.]|uniref:5'-methylthioadenosine/S-adenosylhomocysteine nucleosidase family protein n=1 Tax=Phreatobacter sp. TaxID=1966341 RepID=UPI0022C2D0C8|nr:hypothetical protein [Phreatobacter sp.]MCZ8315572.1 hypothetical protein [Phreatobacter sp.]